MAWPLSQDYNEAIQSPASSFADPELRGGQPVTNALGLPMPCSGNFADVYQINCPATRRSWAVKCFTRQIPGLRERYQQISLHLKQVKLPFMVDFTFLDQGIRIRGAWYPILKMEWVEGFTLNEFVKNHLDTPQALESLSEIWVRVAKALREANIAHCDLQHGNVLLVPENNGALLAVKLVDYDGMCVPALTLLKSLELGHPSYQHPQRLREGIYSLEVDRFSHLVIYTALRSLIVGGRSLWERYDNGDNLLFKQADFEAPGRSPLFADLLRMKNQEVHDLAAVLIDGARLPMDRMPVLEKLVPQISRSQSITVAKANGQAAAQAEKAKSIVGRAMAGPLDPGKPLGGRSKGKVALLGAAWRTAMFAAVPALVLAVVLVAIKVSGYSKEDPKNADFSGPKYTPNNNKGTKGLIEIMPSTPSKPQENDTLAKSIFSSIGMKLVLGPAYGGAPKRPYLERTSKVDSYNPNKLGLYVMHGNVSQWCSDWHGHYDANRDIRDPHGPNSGRFRVIRGGSWSSMALVCRAASRSGMEPEFHGNIGFRVVFAVPLRTR